MGANDSYRVSVLRADGWETVGERSKSASAAKLYDAHATGAGELCDYAAVRLETPAGKVANSATIDNADMILTDVQTEELAAMNGDGDLLAELATLAAEQAARAAAARPARKARGTGTPRGARGSNDGQTGSRYFRATHYLPAPDAEPVPFNDKGEEIRFCTGTVYVIAQKMITGEWLVVDWQFLKKADAPKFFDKIRTDDVVEQICVRRADGKESCRWDRAAEPASV